MTKLKVDPSKFNLEVFFRESAGFWESRKLSFINTDYSEQKDGIEKYFVLDYENHNILKVYYFIGDFYILLFSSLLFSFYIFALSI